MFSMEAMKLFLLFGKITEIHTTKQAKLKYNENYQIHISLNLSVVVYGLGDYIQKMTFNLL